MTNAKLESNIVELVSLMPAKRMLLAPLVARAVECWGNEKRVSSAIGRLVASNRLIADGAHVML